MLIQQLKVSSLHTHQFQLPMEIVIINMEIAVPAPRNLITALWLTEWENWNENSFIRRILYKFSPVQLPSQSKSQQNMNDQLWTYGASDFTRNKTAHPKIKKNKNWFSWHQSAKENPRRLHFQWEIIALTDGKETLVAQTLFYAAWHQSLKALDSRKYRQSKEENRRSNVARLTLLYVVLSSQISWHLVNNILQQSIHQQCFNPRSNQTKKVQI